MYEPSLNTSTPMPWLAFFVTGGVCLLASFYYGVIFSTKAWRFKPRSPSIADPLSRQASIARRTMSQADDFRSGLVA